MSALLRLILVVTSALVASSGAQISIVNSASQAFGMNENTVRDTVYTVPAFAPGAGADKLVVTVNAEAPEKASGVTFGGVPMLEAVNFLTTAGQQSSSIFYLDNPGAIAGDIVVTFPQNSNGPGISAISLSGTAAGFSVADAADGQSVSLTTTVANSFVVACYAANTGTNPDVVAPLQRLVGGGDEAKMGSATRSVGTQMVGTPAATTFAFTDGGDRPATAAVAFTPYAGGSDPDITTDTSRLFGDLTALGGNPGAQMQSVTVSNRGVTQPLMITAVTISGVDALKYSFTNPLPPLPATIPAGSDLEIGVTFTPDVTGGDYAALLSIASDDADSLVVGVDLSSTVALEPKVEVVYEAPLFGGFQLVKGSPPAGIMRQITVRNLGTTLPLTLSDYSISGADAAQFSFGTPPTTVAPGGESVIEVTFSPTPAAGSFSATLEFSTDDQSQPNVSISLDLATAVLPDPVVAADVLVVNSIRSSYTLEGFDPGGGTKLVVTISSEGNGGQVQDPVGVTFGGLAMEEAINEANTGADQGYERTAIFYLDDPGAVPGDIVVSYGANANGVGLAALSILGAEPGPPAASVGGDGKTATLNTAATESLVVASFVSQTDPVPDPSAQAPLAELYSADVGSANGSAGVAIAGPGSNTYEFVGSDTRPVTVAIAFSLGSPFESSLRISNIVRNPDNTVTLTWVSKDDGQAVYAVLFNGDLSTPFDQWADDRDDILTGGRTTTYTTSNTFTEAAQFFVVREE